MSNGLKSEFVGQFDENALTPIQKRLLGDDDLRPIVHFLEMAGDWVEEIIIASELDLSMPVLKHCLLQLQKHLVENDELGKWRIQPALLQGGVNARLVFLETIVEKGLRSFIEVGTA